MFQPFFRFGFCLGIVILSMIGLSCNRNGQEKAIVNSGDPNEKKLAEDENHSATPPMKEHFVEIWNKAGGKFGWYNIDGQWRDGFENGPSPSGRVSIQGFRFGKKPEVALSDLLAPDVPFALDLSGIPARDGVLKGLKELPTLVAFDLRNCFLTDADLSELAEVKALRVLALGSNRQLTGSGLKALQGLNNLSSLDISSTDLKDSDLEPLKSLHNLRALNLDFTEVTDAGMIHLAQLPQLELLSMSNTQVTDQGLKALKPLKNLVSLNIGTTKVTTAWLKDLPSHPKLAFLDLSPTIETDVALAILREQGLLRILPGASIGSGNSSNRPKSDDQIKIIHFHHGLVTDKGLPELKGLTSLKILSINQSKISEVGLKSLAEFPALEELRLKEVPVTKAGLKEIAKLPKLKELGLDKAGLTNADLGELRELPRLTHLYLSDNPLSDDGLHHLKGLTQLQLLYLTRSCGQGPAILGNVANSHLRRIIVAPRWTIARKLAAVFS